MGPERAALPGPLQPVTATVVATGAVAVVFAPLRDRLQRLVNRLLYGDRDEPYRALTLLGRRLEAALPEREVFPTVVATIANALRVPYAAVEVGRDGQFRVAAEHGRPPTNRNGLVHVPLTHGGEENGRLSVARRGPARGVLRGRPGVTGGPGWQVGAAVHTEGLAAALQRSRERLVLAREEERRRVGRDLHDGIGPQLAALSMTVETARDLVAVDPSRAEQLLTDLLTRTEQAVTEVRHEIRQPRPSFFIWLTNLPIIPRAR
jgi:signal transduction histidine kinase